MWIKGISPRNPIVGVAMFDPIDLVALACQRSAHVAIVVKILFGGSARHRDDYWMCPFLAPGDLSHESRNAAKPCEPGLLSVEALPEKAARLQEETAKGGRIRSVYVEQREGAEAGTHPDAHPASVGGGGMLREGRQDVVGKGP